ncbi:glycosyl hydrolase [Aquimarina sp. MMG016]|uniref:T9SS type A sorting domain-containing protein n=1 Tax=Aquimarina sp. MMG016 TaxID=2822690 RepID=UPI001B3A5F6A|nr:glycosyl hydrolase [Aquimarina sp. MMG016]MBQ4818548.1 T9SS type A sorting domain-containing protein [Aquimarina sp. MMG016]
MFRPTKLKSVLLLSSFLLFGYANLSSQSTIPGKFAPTNGKTMLIIGQDLGSVAGYVNSGRFPTPAGVTMYTDIYSMAGLNSITNYGAGDIGSQAALDRFPNSVLAIGLWMVEEADGQGEDHPNGLTEIVNGQHDNELDKFAAFAKKNAPRPIYLRIGYEFDGPWNNYDANKYKNAYRYIVDYLNQEQVSNVAYVWQSATWGATPANGIDNYYPGNQYVDYVGLSFFFYDANFNGNNLDYILNFARTRNKPIMMAEVSAQYHEFDQGTFHPFDNPGSPQQIGGQGIWNQFFRDQLIPFIDDNRDVIRSVAYINADWQSQPQWRWPDAGNGFWGDTRIEANNTISNSWNNYINNGNFLHGGPNLLNDLGITSGPPTPTCNDGIQNGDETGVDCGGSCSPCTTTPTCNDGIQNGNETGVDCGGTCAPCPTPDGDVTVKIEAEAGTLSGQAQYYSDGAASGGNGVAYLDGTGNGFTISSSPKAEKVELIYTSQNSGKISIEVNGQDVGDLNFTSNGSWVGSYTTATININIPSGASFKVVNKNGDVALNVDYLNFITTGTTNPGICTGDDIPTATVSKTNESSQGANDGSITFSFPNTANRTNIEFSIDGGSTYPYNVPDNSGSTTVSNLSPGTYQLYVRWGNNECPQDLGVVTINAGNGGGGTDCSGNCPDGFTFFACDRCWVDEAQAQSAGCTETCNDPSPTCDDGIQNGDETGIDCGGDCEPCITPPTCDDGIQNGDETGVDCGGSCTNSCDTGGCSECINFEQTDTSSFSNQDNAANISIRDGGTTAVLTDNTWRRTNTKYTITANTILEFEFQSTSQGEIHGIGFDSDNSLTSSQIFQVYGTQNWGNRDFDNYTPSGYVSFSIPIGDYYTGDDMYLVLVNDFDNGSGNTSYFRNVRIIDNTSTPTCNDGIQNGDETGVDCGGSCQPCAPSSNLSAKLLPPNDKILLTLGQDLKTVKDYNDGGVRDRGFPEMGGTTTYIAFYSLLDTQFPQYGALGETANGGTATHGNGSTIDVDWGAGPLNARSSILAYPNSSLSIGLSMTEGEATADGVNYWCQGCLAQVGQGQWDNHIKRLASFCKKYSDRAIYLRIAYEFDGNWNVGYENRSNYINAYKRVVDVMRAEGVTNVAYVWQSSASPIDDVLDIQFGEGNFGDIQSWYPGDDYVDWMGISWFVTPDEGTTVLPGIPTQREKANEVVSFARSKNKPVYIAESTPQGYDLVNTTDCNISNVWDGTAAQGCISMSAGQIWNEWFAPFFEYIYNNKDVIRQVHYINANWEDDTALFGQGNRANGYWGRAGVHVNTTIANNWNTEVSKPVWLHGSSNLNSQLLQSRFSASNQLIKNNVAEISIYPNPSSGMFTIKSENVSRILISDLNGRIIKSIPMDSSDEEIKIDINEVEKGMYLITTLNKGKSKSVERLIIN